MKIAIVILNYKSWKDTLNEADFCNESLYVNYKDIIIVDNASPNESKEQLQKAADEKGFILLTSEKNAGYASGNNIGLRYVYERHYDYAWILNNDIIIQDKDIINKLVSVLQKDIKVAVVNPEIYAPDGYLYNRDAKRPNFIDFTVGMFRYRKIGREINDLGGYAYVYRPQGCCMMVDLKKMAKVDYMDEHTFLYVEEPILAERLLKKNYRCACCLETSIIHNHSVTVKKSFDKKKIRKMNNESFSYYLKEYRKFNKLQVYICCVFNNLKMLALEGR